MDMYWAAPPVSRYAMLFVLAYYRRKVAFLMLMSRTLTALTLTTSFLVYGRLLDYSRIIFYLPWIFKFPPELWRIFSSFWLTSPGLGILFDTYFRTSPTTRSIASC